MKTEGAGVLFRYKKVHVWDPTVASINHLKKNKKKPQLLRQQ